MPKLAQKSNLERLIKSDARAASAEDAAMASDLITTLNFFLSHGALAVTSSCLIHELSKLAFVTKTKHSGETIVPAYVGCQLQPLELV